MIELCMSLGCLIFDRPLYWPYNYHVHIYSCLFLGGDNPKVEGQEFFYPSPGSGNRTLSQWKIF